MKSTILILSLLFSLNIFSNTAERWEAVGEKLEALQHSLDDDHTDVFEFARKSVRTVTDDSIEQLQRYCGEESDLDKHLRVRAIESQTFYNKSIKDIYSHLLEHFSMFEVEQAKAPLLVSELVSLLTSLGHKADKITLVTVGGVHKDCGGDWGTEHYVISINNQNYSYSIGGGN